MNDEQRKGEVEKHRRIYNATHHVGEVSKIPQTAHFAVLVNESMRYDDGYGDERSGPSYSTMNYMGYIFFDDEEALSEWIIENNQKKTFRVFSVKPARVELKTTISVEE